MRPNRSLVKKFWKRHTIIHALIKDSESPDIARNHLHNYLMEQWRILYQLGQGAPTLQWGIQMTGLRIFRRIISKRSSKLTGFSIVDLLWNLARENNDRLPHDLSYGFLVEIGHLLSAISGNANPYEYEKPLAFAKMHGRKAAILRSSHLNTISSRCSEYINRYPHGFLDSVIASRKKNRERILNKLNGSQKDWTDYKWHLKNVIRDAETLGHFVSLSGEERKAITMARAAKLPFGITPYYVSLMDHENSRKNDHAIRAQVIPPLSYVEQMIKNRLNLDKKPDFMLESDTSPVDLVTRRYPYIAILKPYNTCSQICVYCQRNWEIQDVLDCNALATKEKIDKAFAWFEKNTQVNEILVTGGDPFVMSNTQIESLLSRICKMDHIIRVRFGSRTPVVLPQRITPELVKIIERFHVPGKREIALVTHFEHSYEVTPEARDAVQLFRKAGMSIYNQAVFTIENSRRFELAALRQQLRLIGVDSYYTFNTKGKEETKKYRVPMARLQQEVKEEARLMPGLVRTDEPVYNVPKLGKNYVRAEQHHSLLTILPNGQRVYEFHPWEKNLRLVDTYIDTDVSIYDYLGELKKRGESLKDYKSIWYYY